MKPPPKKFCSAPWSQAVLTMSGHMRPCCRNGASYGEFTRIGLKGAWHGQIAQEFRRKIATGEFPDDQCRACYANGTVAQLDRDVSTILIDSWKHMFAYARSKAIALEDESHIWKVRVLLTRTELDREAREILKRFFAIIATLRLYGDPGAPDFPHRALQKLELVGRIIYDFLWSELSPRAVAPNRQVQLIAVCNARCIQCPGLFSREIIDGAFVENGRKKVMDDAEADAAFARTEDMTDFFLNGSELLAYRRWRDVAEKLYSGGVSFSLSTNGILLDRKNVDFLFSKQYLSHLNVSFDGATKGTLEAIRINVEFDNLVRNVEYMLSAAARTGSSTNIGFSFVMMKRNYTELPELFRLIDRMRGDNRGLRVGVLVQSLENMDIPGYHDFVAEEHLALIPEPEVRSVLARSLRLSDELGIPARAFYAWDLGDFVMRDMPLPPMPAAASRLVRIGSGLAEREAAV